MGVINRQQENEMDETEDKPWYDDAAEVGKQAIAGLVVDTPARGLRAVQAYTPTGSFADRTADALLHNAATQDITQRMSPDMRGRGAFARFAMNHARSLSPAIAPTLLATAALPATATAGTILGTGAILTGLLSGGDKYQVTKEALRHQGIDDKTAQAEALRAGAISGGADAIATGIGGKIIEEGLLKAGLPYDLITRALKSGMSKAGKGVQKGASSTADFARWAIHHRHAPLAAKLLSIPAIGALGDYAMSEAPKRAEEQHAKVVKENARQAAATKAGIAYENADRKKTQQYEQMLAGLQAQSNKPKVTIIQHPEYDEDEYEEDDEE